MFLRPSEKVRRGMLAAVAALLVAQAMVLGSPTDAPPAPLGELVLTLGWLVLFTAWAVWNAVVRPGAAIMTRVTAALAFLAGVFAVRLWIGTSNDWLASIVTWQWVVVPAAFILVRELTTALDDARGMIGVLIATATATLVPHVAPVLAHFFTIDYPTQLPAPRLLPQDYEPIATTAASGIPFTVRDWSRDLFWLALAAPAAALLGWGSRRLLMLRDRLLAWAPFTLLVIGLAGRAALDVPAPAGWRTAANTIVDAPLGVGPGLYDRFVARHAPPDALTVSLDPPNSFLAVTIGGGWLALAAFVAALALVGVALRRRPKPAEAAPVPPEYRSHWELHVGALVGILGGMGLQYWEWPGGFAPPLLALGFSAGLRIAVWFATFYCVEGCLLFGALDRVLGWGIFAVMAAAWVYDVIRPGLAEAFAVAAAVAINLVAPPTVPAVPHRWLMRWLPVGVSGVLVVGFVMMVGMPAFVSTNTFRHLVHDTPQYQSRLRMVQEADGPAAKDAAHSAAAVYIRQKARQPLLAAARLNGRDPALPSVLVPWLADLAEHRAGFDSTLHADAEPDVDAVRNAERAESLDFENAERFVIEFQARLRLARGSSKNRSQHMARAHDLIAEITSRDPALAARLHWRIADTHYALNDKGSAIAAARRAKQLDDEAPGPHYRLTPAERQQLATWLSAEPKK